MHAPLTTRPSTVSRAAPTRNPEYGVYENSLAGPVFGALVPAQMERNFVVRLPSKHDLMRSSCCSTDNVQDLIAAAILSLAARSLQSCLFPQLYHLALGGYGERYCSTIHRGQRLPYHLLLDRMQAGTSAYWSLVPLREL